MIDPWFLDSLVCPVNREPLRLDGSSLVSTSGLRYPVVDGIPVLLTEGEQTFWVADGSRNHSQSGSVDDYAIDTIGVSPKEAATIRRLIESGDSRVDPVVSCLVSHTNGIAYKHLVGGLQDYPIPDLRLPPGDGRTLLDIGCSWGRWCIAAARKGYRPVGIDPSLGAVKAAARVSRKMGLEIRFVVGDARMLPFRDGLFDRAFSYSVIQHFAHEAADRAFAEIGRVLRSGGESLVQMPTTFGLRCLYHQARRQFRTPKGFEVRYATLPALRRRFDRTIGPTSTSVDCYFGIGLQKSDWAWMTPKLKAVIAASETLRVISRVVPPIKYLADSIYLHSRKPIS